jgi:hypothetical protein
MKGYMSKKSTRIYFITSYLFFTFLTNCQISSNVYSTCSVQFYVLLKVKDILKGEMGQNEEYEAKGIGRKFSKIY